MKLANKLQYRYFRGLGLHNPFYWVSHRQLGRAIEHAREQHGVYESPQQLHARALARVVWQKREQHKWRRRFTILFALAALLLVLHLEGYAQGNIVVRQPDGTKLHTVCDSGCGGAASFADNAAFTAGTTSVNIDAGVFNDAIANLTAGSAGALRLTADRMAYINVARWGGGVLGAMANYGTSPGAVLVPGVNAFITNSLTDDVSDRAARLLGVVYGSQAQQLKQTATNFNLQMELATGGTLYDARQIRALTSSDVVSAAQSGAPWSVTGTITPADAFTNPATTVNGNALHSWFNGSSWDRARSAGVGNIVAATGLGAQVPYCEFLTVLPVLTNGTYGAAQCDTSGRLLIGSISGTVTVSGTVTANQGGTWTVQPGNTANTTPWLVTSRIVGNTGATLDAAPAAAMPTNAVVTAGRDSTQTGGGAAVPVVCDKSLAVTAAAVASTIVIPLVASKTTYICGFVITGAGAAGTMQWKSGTGTTCGTSTTNLTGAMATAIGGTVSFGTGIGTVMRDAAAAQDTCITMATTSATAAGVVTFAQF